MSKPVYLIILDGWGENPNLEGNAIAQANTPTVDKLSQHYPQTLLQASGISVGLPWGEVGNSEVGHLTALRAVSCQLSVRREAQSEAPKRRLMADNR